MGFEFKERSQSSVKLDMLGEEVAYEVLNVMEYTSDRCLCGSRRGQGDAARSVGSSANGRPLHAPKLGNPAFAMQGMHERSGSRSGRHHTPVLQGL